MKRYKVWLVLALVFLAGFAGGVVATRLVVRRFVQEAIANPDWLRNRFERDLNRELRLDARQREQVHEILQRSQGQLRELRREYQPRFGAVVQGARGEISAVLTPGQQERFERFQRENRGILQPRWPRD